jgi:hypothetical protein
LNAALCRDELFKGHELMLTERILLIIGATAITVALFAFVPGPMWMRVLIGGIIVVADLIVILSLRRPRAPGQHPHSANH